MPSDGEPTARASVRALCPRFSIFTPPSFLVVRDILEPWRFTVRFSPSISFLFLGGRCGVAESQEHTCSLRHCALFFPSGLRLFLLTPSCRGGSQQRTTAACLYHLPILQAEIYHLFPSFSPSLTRFPRPFQASSTMACALHHSPSPSYILGGFQNARKTQSG